VRSGCFDVRLGVIQQVVQQFTAGDLCGNRVAHFAARFFAKQLVSKVDGILPLA
jgi:hypothetical protein